MSSREPRRTPSDYEHRGVLDAEPGHRDDHHQVELDEKRPQRGQYEKLNQKEKKQLSDDAREFRSKRKEIQKKLIKFATRIPIFMFLTDYREQTLRDAITKLELGLFKRVTSLEVKEFELLLSIGLFNSALMNDAVYKFRRHEDSSLLLHRHQPPRRRSRWVYDTVLSPSEALWIFEDRSSYGV